MLVFVFSEQNKRIPRVQTADLQNLQSLLFAKFAHKTAFGAVQLAVPDRPQRQEHQSQHKSQRKHGFQNHHTFHIIVRPVAVIFSALIIRGFAAKSQSPPPCLLICKARDWKKKKQYVRDKPMKEEKIKISDERKTMGLSSLSKTILPFARQILGSRGFVEVDILAGWHEIVGEELAEFCLPQKIDFPRRQKSNGTLYLNVASGAFALEIQHREKFILEKINTRFGYQAVAKIKIVQNSSLTLEKLDKIKKEERSETLVSPEEENYINNLAEDLNHSELKEILVKLGKSVFNDNKIENKKK